MVIDKSTENQTMWKKQLRFWLGSEKLQKEWFHFDINTKKVGKE